MHGIIPDLPQPGKACACLSKRCTLQRELGSPSVTSTQGIHRCHDPPPSSPIQSLTAFAVRPTLYYDMAKEVNLLNLAHRARSPNIKAKCDTPYVLVLCAYRAVEHAYVFVTSTNKPETIDIHIYTHAFKVCLRFAMPTMRGSTYT